MEQKWKGVHEMQVAVVISASSEWEALRPLFPGANLQHYPYGEYFQAAVAEFPVTFFYTEPYPCPG